MNFKVRSKICESLSNVWKMPLPALLPASIMAIALLLQSCATTKTNRQQSLVESATITDSVSVATERTVRPVIVPSSTAMVELSIDSIEKLPAGARYLAKSGRASVALVKAEGGTIIASATCDSLTLIVESLRTEIFHLSAVHAAAKQEINETKIIEINVPTGWQWFQIWTGRVLAAAILIWMFFKLKK